MVNYFSFIYIHTCTCGRARARAYIHAHTHTHIYIHTHTYKGNMTLSGKKVFTVVKLRWRHHYSNQIKMVASVHALIQYGCYPLWDEYAMGNFRHKRMASDNWRRRGDAASQGCRVWTSPEAREKQEDRLLPPWLGTSASGTVKQELTIVLKHPGLSWFAVAAQGNRDPLW